MPALERTQSSVKEFPRSVSIRRRRRELALAALVLPLALYAGPGLGASSSKCPSIGKEAQDLTDAKLTKREPSCRKYLGSYRSSVKDKRRGELFQGALVIAEKGNKCEFTTNSIPNHDFNDGPEGFVNDVKAVCETYEIPMEPRLACEPGNDDCKPTQLSTAYDNAIMLNGSKLDLLAAACFCVGDEPLTQEKIGCLDMKWGWRYDPMFLENGFGADMHNAHAQPDGAYHYHGSPRALFQQSPVPQEESPVIGFAADGFPIYGPYIKDARSGKIRKVKSSWSLKKGWRQHIANERCFPGGRYDGSFRDDYEFKKGSGDLDRCNGMKRNGQYGYYVTDEFPYVVNCFYGNVDESFKKAELDIEHAH